MFSHSSVCRANFGFGSVNSSLTNSLSHNRKCVACLLCLRPTERGFNLTRLFVIALAFGIVGSSRRYTVRCPLGYFGRLSNMGSSFVSDSPPRLSNVRQDNDHDEIRSDSITATTGAG